MSDQEQEQEHVITMTAENRPYFDALIMLAAGIRNDNAEDKLVGCIEEMLKLRHLRDAVRSAVNECLVDIAQSVMESGGLPIEQLPLDHARITLASIDKRLTRIQTLLAEQAGEK